MSLGSQDLIRFRRTRKRRHEINLEHVRLTDKAHFVPQFFTEEEWTNSFLPRKRKKKKFRRLRKFSHKERLSYGVRPSFKMRSRVPESMAIRLGTWRRFNSQGQPIPINGSFGATLSFEDRIITNNLDSEKTWGLKHPGPPYREGGNFTNIKIKLPHHEVQGVSVYTTKPSARINGMYFTYTGGFAQPAFVGETTAYGTYRDAGISPWNNSLLPDVSSYGPSAFKSLAPSPEVAHVGQFLVELRELPRAIADLKRTAASFDYIWRNMRPSDRLVVDPRTVANQYLGYQFGWAPFLSDIESVINLARNLNQVTAEMAAKNNTWQVVRKVIDEDSSITQIGPIFYDSGMSPTGQNIFDCCDLMTVQGGQCRLYSRLVLREEYKVWAEGSMKFYCPELDANLADFDSALTTAQRVLTLSGARVTPSLLWKVTPWTWLVDWFTRIGDNMSNISAELNDRVVSKYMYVMRHTTRAYDWNTVINTWDRGQVALRWTRSVETKQRDAQTSHYGFNVPSINLSAKQWSILGALGLSRRA